MTVSLNLIVVYKLCSKSEFNMSYYRKPEIQNDLPKITKVKLIFFFYIYHQNFDQKSLTMLSLAF